MNELVSYLISERNFKQQSLIIGITGNIGVGKTYISNKITTFLTDEGYEVTLMSIASPLKKLIQHIGFVLKNSDIPTEDDFVFFQDKELIKQILNHEDHNQINRILKECDGNWRCLAQKIGEYVRKTKDPCFWIDNLIQRIESIENNIDFIIIPDVRYLNEYQRLKERFQDRYVQIRIVRPLDDILKSLGITKDKYLQMLNHESEKEINLIPTDFEINNVKEV